MENRLHMPRREKSFGDNRKTSQAEPGTGISRQMISGVPAGAAILVLAAVFAYLPSLSGEFVMDDDLFVTANNLIQNPDGLRKLWSTPEYEEFYPLSYSTFWIEWRLWESNTAGYHTVNLTMHIIGAMLIWVILRKLSIPGAFLAAVIFAVHPVNVESVAWIAQRRNVAAMLFLLLSILYFLKLEDPSSLRQKGLHNPDSSHAAGRSLLWYWLSLAAFVLAMLSKGSAAVLPALLLGILWWQGSLTRRNLLRIAPFFLLAAALTGVNVWYQTHGEHIEIRNAGFGERLLGAGCVPWFYLYKALLPFDLSFIYPRWRIDVGDFRWWLPLMASIIVTMVLWRFRKGWSRPILFAWGFFCVSLVPVMGFTDVGFMKYSLVADHYQHIAIIGIIALVAAGWGIWRRGRNPECSERSSP